MNEIVLILSFILSVVVIWSIISISNSNQRMRRTLDEVLEEIKKINSKNPTNVESKAATYDKKITIDRSSHIV